MLSALRRRTPVSFLLYEFVTLAVTVIAVTALCELAGLPPAVPLILGALVGWALGYARRPTGGGIVDGLVLALVLATIAGPVLAAAAAPAVVVDSGATVTVPWGAWLSGLIGTLTEAGADHPGTIIAALVAWALRRLPGEVRAILLTWRADQLVTKAITAGLNSVANATADKRLTFQTAQPVIGAAVQYATSRGAQSVLDFVGGRRGLAEMIWARLDLDPALSAADFQRISNGLDLARVR